MQGFDAAQYQQKMGHAPIYHGGTLAQGSLKEKLGVIYRKYEGLAKVRGRAGLTDRQKWEMIRDFRDVYESSPYDVLNLWPATRDWLRNEKVPAHLFSNTPPT
jgi:hypothetical protein